MELGVEVRDVGSEFLEFGLELVAAGLSCLEFLGGSFLKGFFVLEVGFESGVSDLELASGVELSLTGFQVGAGGCEIGFGFCFFFVELY
ncbi:MAG: hypothetical protein F4180_05975 [Chloroflexi bacterium]|nr:hypothetical protein [Chloroflexota bacterium]